MEVLGYDPEVFGAIRISGIQRHIRNEFREENGFHSGRKEKQPAVGKSKVLSASVFSSTERPKTPQDAIKEMQHEIKFLRQELEFLKKISLARTTKK
jgi:hypothetical protein